MTDRSKAFWLGIFILLAVGLAAWLVLFIKPRFGDGKVILTVRFSNIEKISEGTLVTYGGRQVGEVIEINEIADPRCAPADAFGNLYIYELKLKVDSMVKVFLYDEIIFATAGLLGEKSIAIIPKSAPSGSPPPYEVTCDVLYATSMDKLDQTLNKLVDVATTFQGCLHEINHFIKTNNQDLNVALKSLSNASNAVETFIEKTQTTDVIKKAASALARAESFFADAEESNIIERLGGSFDSLHEASILFSTGEGTFARLMKSDNFYVELTMVLSQLQTVLHAIKNYGLFYQFDRKWQRSKDMNRHYTEMPTAHYCK